MFRNVLVGVDGRANGRDAIALAGELNPLSRRTPGAVSEERKASMGLLEQERAAVDVEAELISVVASSPGAALHRQADEQAADLLVVGTCSHGAFGRVMLGDDTRAALNGSPCAVSVAARGYAESPKPIAAVGVAYNGSRESERALAEAKEVAAPTRAVVRALEVVAIPTYAFSGLGYPVIGDTIDAMLKEATERMERLPGVDGRAVYGMVGEELAAFSDELDILVVGSRSYGPVQRLVVGSTSDYLQRNARCSLLVLPREGTEGP
jgi:nucleotide-binding universal stress UspA family protein